MPNRHELTCCLEVPRSDPEKSISKGESNPRTPHGDEESHDEQ